MSHHSYGALGKEISRDWGVNTVSTAHEILAPMEHPGMQTCLLAALIREVEGLRRDVVNSRNEAKATTEALIRTMKDLATEVLKEFRKEPLHSPAKDKPVEKPTEKPTEKPANKYEDDPSDGMLEAVRVLGAIPKLPESALLSAAGLSLRAQRMLKEADIQYVSEITPDRMTQVRSCAAAPLKELMDFRERILSGLPLRPKRLPSNEVMEGFGLHVRARRALSREGLVFVEEIRPDRFFATRMCGEKTIEQLMEFRKWCLANEY